VIQFVTRQIALTSIAYVDRRLYVLYVAQSLDQPLVLLLRLIRAHLAKITDIKRIAKVGR
jgi:hypothetical protein